MLLPLSGVLRLSLVPTEDLNPVREQRKVTWTLSH